MTTSEPPVLATGDMKSPQNVSQASERLSGDSVTKSPGEPPLTSPPTLAVPIFPPPKTDKPRPHVCMTCMRSFARLEHLKRHERSHTKEKPFECPSCTRCFARRDLLLRHQQKLHSTTTPSSRPRKARRESTAGVANGRVRKNSVASASTAAMRPRANTMSHIDSSGPSLMTSGAFGRQFISTHNHHNSFNGVTANLNFGFRGLGSSGHVAASGLPRLETCLSTDLSGGLRTAPPFGGFGAEFDVNGTEFDINNGNTINPHALHMHGMGMPIDSPFDLAQHMHSGIAVSQPMTEDDSFDWMMQGFDSQMAFTLASENAIDDSSPSVMSTNSPVGFNDATMHSVNGAFMEGSHSVLGSMWQPPMSNLSHMVNSPMSMDVNPFLTDAAHPTADTVSPESLLAQKGSTFDMNFPTPPEQSTVDPGTMAAMSASAFALPLKDEHMVSTLSSSSIDSSLRQSSIATSASSDLVNDHIRNTLITGLSQNLAFGQRKTPQPTVNSPLSPSGGSKNKGFNPAVFPSTQDLQRHVSAYIKYFHPHLPFLHIASLNFESSEYPPARTLANNGHAQFSPGPAAGGSCLMLSVAAVGALFEDEIVQSRELFECAKRVISMYLEERRRFNMSKGAFPPYQRPENEDTPLWLVQAMLLNVIYGHNSGDKTGADIASNHCAALVSLARGAELAKPYPTNTVTEGSVNSTQACCAHNHNVGADGWSTHNTEQNDNDWHEWKAAEERKRTLYSIFILSSLLVTAYNRAPALTNSEIRLDLPCSEELWAADSPQTWRALGGSTLTEPRPIQFAAALTHLLTAAHRRRRAAAQPSNGEPWTVEEPELRPSSFGCLILINALHNYIWETRQRHLGRQWTPHEIESMHAHIEPALSAWQAAWNSDPTHTVERPNPFGAGPLSADSIPLLDLAYVRLFVDFGRSKEAYWQRDYDTMALELAKGAETMTAANSCTVHGLQSPPLENGYGMTEANHGQQSDHKCHEQQKAAGKTDADNVSTQQSTQRERYLRKAAFYAADHLIASDRLGVGINERNARELPMQSILCACDSAQVLAEWTATVQQRIGSHVGILGRDLIDLSHIPRDLLDDEDAKLLGMIQDLVDSMERKTEANGGLADAREGGYGSRILIVTSQIMAQAAIWPVTKLMARSLETQADHIKSRVLGSGPIPAN